MSYRKMQVPFRNLLVHLNVGIAEQIVVRVTRYPQSRKCTEKLGVTKVWFSENQVGKK